MGPTRTFGLGLGLAAALAAGSARAQEEKAPAKTSPPPNPIESLIGLDANSDMVIDREEVPESGRAAFDRLVNRGDANENGKLEVAELRAMLGRLRRVGDPAAAAERGRRLRAMDKDGDKKISREEFRGPAPLFDRLDANQDGFITEPELGRPRPGGTPSANRKPEAGRPRRLARMDKDGNGKITREEFQGPERLFDRLDADRDGTISREELRKAARERSESSEKGPEPK